MKLIYSLPVLLFLALSLFGQSPQSFNYQAVVRDAGGNIIPNSEIGIRISILQGAETGTPSCVEEFNITTNSFGLITLAIGSNNPTDFSIIEWSSGPYYIKLEIDPDGGTDYTTMGISQLISVPYALHATTVDYIEFDETDPLFDVSVAKGITQTDTAGWNAKLDSYTETDPAYNTSIAKGITGIDTAAWNAKSDFSGNYDDLTGKPDLDLKLDTITTMAWDRNINDDFSGQWEDITGKPDLSIWDKDSTDDVILTGDQTIGGNKTFSNTIIASNGINASSKNITNLAEPVSEQDAATKAYVDLLIARIEVLEEKLGIGTVEDLDGNVYTIVSIGTQTWMVENLKTTQFNDGTSIPLVTDNSTWNGLSTPAYCWYDNDEGTYKEPYGALYNWFAVNTSKLCPAGWHVPSETDFSTLVTFLGGNILAGGKLKETGTTFWQTPNTGATNEYSFTALPGGCRGDYGTFYYIGTHGDFWSSTIYNTGTSISFNLHHDSAGITFNHHQNNIGFSVRCIKD